MKIVVCIKQVPATQDVVIDPETKRLKRENVAAEMNPFDLYALEEALRLVEAHGGEAIALSMGPSQAAASLREALCCGADRAILLSDRAFAGSDTWATSYALAQAVRHLGGVDLVLCGKQAVDGDTAQVGPGIAAHLDWPQVTYVSAVREVADGTMTVVRLHEEGCDVVRTALPAVLTVVKDINVPRVPTLRRCREAHRMDIPVLAAADIGAEAACLGLEGSPTRVVKAAPPPPRRGKTVVIEGPSDRSADQLVRTLRSLSLIH